MVIRFYRREEMNPVWRGQMQLLIMIFLFISIIAGCGDKGGRDGRVAGDTDQSDNTDNQDGGGQMRSFPRGYVDSPFIIPDGSAIYFLHSVASTYDMLTANPSARPVTDYLPGHQGQGGPYWWNTDIYVSYKNPDGTWGEPQNLGPNINTEHMECCPWVNDDQTVLIFTRESVTDPSLSGSFISRRENKGEPWGVPERLHGELGDYATNGFHNFHLTPGGDLYFETSYPGNAVLYWAKGIGGYQWAEAEPLDGVLQSDLDDTQPWLNGEETLLCFNRRDESGNTELLCADRPSPSSPWGSPSVVEVVDFADPAGALVWGEPSFTEDGTMFFVRFDTSTTGWDAELLQAPRNNDGSYGPPERLRFRY